ncbi:hypothetical protein EIL87_17785 [Saccharopolyspora rhizosphaerae]|uniref:Uncharacterized protein n=1 Tax=Saccharopolyspora rhizosphaerae TaxID=2492662 RepID=A0A3R8Q1S8_9PSEU|nr:hypothetical protein [Saccharopolyspora rhizosphaerae]RRO15121.1 hypothetical protein EIL87_17785 [Saccharopolyspora rhizosphaerae]
MRSLIRPIVVGAFILPLAVAGAGMASAGETMTPRGGGSCHHFACNWWDVDTTVTETETSIINAGILG